MPVARFNRRGFVAAKRIHHRTGRQACSSAVRGLHQTLKLGTRHIRRKEHSFDDEINLHRPFVTIYCHLRRYLVGAHSVRPGSPKSYGSWANNVRPYGSAGADEFTNGVPRSYLRAPSLAALPQFTLAHPTEKIVHTKKIFLELTIRGQFSAQFAVWMRTQTAPQPCHSASTGLIPMPIVFSRPENAISRPENGISRPENPQSREEQRTEQKRRVEQSIAENSRAETKLRMENDSD